MSDVKPTVQKLIIIRNILYRLFLVGMVISVLTQLPLGFITEQGFNHSAITIGCPSICQQPQMISYIIFVRQCLFYLILTPALALHWTIAQDKF